MLKRIIVLILMLSCFVLNLSAQQLMQDVVYLEDGSVIRGQIIEQIPDVSIKVQTIDGNIFAYKMEEVEKIVKESLGIAEIKEEKSPAIALVLSLVFPGLGQYYNGEIKKGIIQEAMVVGGAALALTVGIDHQAADTIRYSFDRTNALFWIGAGVASVGSLWSLVDAPLSAGRINRGKKQQRWGHLIEFNKEKYVLGLDVTRKKEGMGVKFSLHF